MNAHDQIQMFEPEGKKLVELVGVYVRNAAFEAKRALNLAACGYTSSANACSEAATEYADRAAVCEIAYQFETLARLK